MRLSPVFLGAALLGAAVAIASPDSPDLHARVDAVFQDLDRTDSPGCSLGVYRDGRIDYSRGYGMANLELSVANSPQSVFDIGSTSKQFTAFSIHLLARDGKLSLDDDVRKWLPEVPDYRKPVTIRHLLHHTGGLRDYIVVMYLQGLAEADLTTDDDALGAIARQKKPNFAPGEEYLYSNTGYFLLGQIVKRASGKSLRDFAAEQIFGPLGMRHTQFNDAHGRLIAGRATGYRRVPGGAGFEINMSDWEQIGDGGVQTTVEDLARWDQNFYEPKVGDARLLDAMQTPGILNNGKKLDYASALIIGSFRGLRTVSHGGAWAGYRAQLLRFPDQKFSVACLCNLGDADPSALARKVAGVYLGELMKPEAKPAAGRARSTSRLTLSASDRQRLAGAYRDRESGGVLAVSAAGDKLEAEWHGRRHPLAAVEPNRLAFEDIPGRELVFSEAGRGGRPVLRIHTEGQDEDETFDPIALWSPKPEELAEFVGIFASGEVDTTWRLVVDGGKLFIVHRGFPHEPLQPTVADNFAGEDITLTFMRDPARKITGFSVGAGRARDIVFVKREG